MAGGFLAVLAMMCSLMLKIMEMVMLPHLPPKASVEVNKKMDRRTETSCAIRWEGGAQNGAWGKSLHPGDKPLRTQRAGQQVESKRACSKVSLSMEGGTQSNPFWSQELYVP